MTTTLSGPSGPAEPGKVSAETAGCSPAMDGAVVISTPVRCAAQRARALFRLRVAFYAVMLSPALVTVAFGFMVGGPVHATDVVATVVPAMALFGLGIAYALLRPLSPDLAVPDGTGAGPGLARLPSHAALATVGYTALLMGGHHLLAHWYHDHVPGGAMVVYPLALITIYALVLGLSLYFAVGVLVVQFRDIANATEADPSSSRQHLRHRVMLAILGTMLPLLVASAHHRLTERYPELESLNVDRLVSFDLFSSALLVGCALWFVHQVLTRPVEALSSAMRAVESGHTEVRAAVLTNDELGTLAAGFNRMLDAMQEREALRQTLSRYIPEGVADTALRGQGPVRPVSREATILFTDIAGFTALCEALTPLEVVTLLNEYFTAIAAPVRAQGGVVTQFQGDALVAGFNLPIEAPDHAYRAVRAALDIQTMLRSRTFGPALEIPTRIGISTGLVVGGTVGDSVHLGYTLHGDVVNLAQRLEQANKLTNTHVLICSRTAQLLNGRLDIDRLAPLQIPGRSAEVLAFAVHE